MPRITRATAQQHKTKEPKLYKLLVGKHIGPNLNEEKIKITDPNTGEVTERYPSWEYEAGTGEDMIMSEIDLVKLLGPEKFAYADERTSRRYTRMMQTVGGSSGNVQDAKGERGKNEKMSPVGGRDDVKPKRKRGEEDPSATSADEEEEEVETEEMEDEEEVEEEDEGKGDARPATSSPKTEAIARPSTRPSPADRGNRPGRPERPGRSEGTAEKAERQRSPGSEVPTSTAKPTTTRRPAP